MSSSTIDTPMARRAGLDADSWPTALARPIRQGIAWIGSRRRLRRHIEELKTLDDRMLADIGLRREHVVYLAQYGYLPKDAANDP